MGTTNLNIRIDADLKRKAEQIFEELGLSMSAALNVFLRQTVRNNGIPFDLRLDNLNAETAAAIDDVNNGRNLSRPFSSVSELMEDLDADD